MRKVNKKEAFNVCSWNIFRFYSYDFRTLIRPNSDLKPQ